MSDLISRQWVIKAIDRFIPADPMMSDYTQGISVGLAIATGCIEKFSQENADSSQGLVKDLISREDACEAVKNEMESWLEGDRCDYRNVVDAIMDLPSAEPKPPSNGSITCVKSEKMHYRTTDDCIRRQDVLHELDGCDYELKDWQRWKLKTMVRDIPSAEKTQLSEEGTTSVCKCPCEYRDPCDVCHYDAYRGHGCPAEEGMKDE